MGAGCVSTILSSYSDPKKNLYSHERLCAGSCDSWGTSLANGTGKSSKGARKEQMDRRRGKS
jgi:hypothetical protein